MHLAQLNIARLRHPLDHRESQDFADGLVPINLLAESSPGFVWRLQTDEGDATSLRPHPDPNLIVNLSVWRSMDELRDFSYRSAHSLFLRRRAEWFHPMTNASAVAWWIDEGREPSVDEAFDRMQFLRTHGPSPWAFGVTRPGAQLAIKRVVLDDGDAMSLIDELNAELSEMYPEPGSTFFRLDPDQVTGTNGAFLLATLDGVAVACGAFRVLGQHLAGTRANLRKNQVCIQVLNAMIIIFCLELYKCKDNCS